MDLRRNDILIVDDSHLIRKLLGELLADRHRIWEAADGLEGVRLLLEQADEIAIVLLDLVMPQVDGIYGDSIPLTAQVVAVADVFDALTHKRVYKPAYSIKEAA